MPFRIGRDPVRYTLRYLDSGRLVFKERVRVMLCHYNYKPTSHAGLREFLHWYTPQIQYKNPNVQIVSMKDRMPSPFIRLFLDNNEEVLVDVENKSKEQILEHLTKILGKSKEVLRAERQQSATVLNKYNFGRDCQRYCVCELPGQVPCPNIVPLPKIMRGKYSYREEEEEA